MWSVVANVSSIFSLLAFVVAAFLTYRRHRLYLIEKVPPEKRDDVAKAYLDRVSVPTADLTKKERYNIALNLIQARQKRLQWVIGALTFSFLVSASIAAYAYTQRQEIYSVRVVILDLNGQPTDGSELTASVGYEALRVSGGWEIRIPRTNVPNDGVVSLHATRSPLQGTALLTLGSDMVISTEIQLEPPASAEVRGTVLDRSNRAIAGASVSVLGHGDEAVVTDQSGTFLLNAHAGLGQEVRLHVEHPQFKSKDQYHLAGGEPATIILDE